MSKVIKTYYEPLYKTYISAFIESDPNKARKRIERLIKDDLGDIEFNSQAKTIEYYDRGAQRLIMWFKKKEPQLLAHELIHVIEYCFERRKLPFNMEDSEVIAYYMEHLFEKFYPLFNKVKQK